MNADHIGGNESKPRYQAKLASITHLAKDDNTIAEIAENLNLSYASVYKYCHDNNISVISPKEKTISLIRFHAALGLTCREISQKIGRGVNYIKKHAAAAGIQFAGNEWSDGGESQGEGAAIKALAADLHKAEIARRVGWSLWKVEKYCRKNNIAVLSKMQSTVARIRKGVTQGLDSEDIAGEIGISEFRVKEIAGHLNIPVIIRPRRERSMRVVKDPMDRIRRLRAEGDNGKAYPIHWPDIRFFAERKRSVMEIARILDIKPVDIAKYTLQNGIEVAWGPSINTGTPRRYEVNLSPESTDIECIVHLDKKGLSVPDISKKLRISQASIVSVSRKQGLNLKLFNEGSVAARISDLAEKGRTRAEIANETGIKLTTVKTTCWIYGITPRVEEKWLKPVNFHDEIKRFLGDGMSYRKIGKALKVAEGCIASYCRSRGLKRSIPTKTPEIIQMALAGGSAKEIASAVGISIPHVYAQLKKNGVEYRKVKPRKKI